MNKDRNLITKYMCSPKMNRKKRQGLCSKYIFHTITPNEYENMLKFVQNKKKEEIEFQCKYLCRILNCNAGKQQQQ